MVENQTNGREKRPLISIIMPIYNPGGYFREAVESVLAQSLADFELLMIDDGSTDGTGALCEEYAAKDPRVRVKHGRNGGICASRNVGLDLARGEWLAFCDHDDRVEPDWLESMMNAAKSEAVDVVKCGHSWEDRFSDGRPNVLRRASSRPFARWTLADLLGDTGYALYSDIGSLVWDGLYRRSFWESAGLRFNTEFKHGGEDCYINVDIVKRAGKGVWIGKVLYRHFLNQGVSTASGYHPDMIETQLEIARHEKEVLGFASPAERVAMFKKWSGHLRLFILNAAGCDLSWTEKVGLMARYYDEIVGEDRDVRLQDLHSAGLRVLAFLARHRMFSLWLVLLKVRDWFDRHRL